LALGASPAQHFGALEAITVRFSRSGDGDRSLSRFTISDFSGEGRKKNTRQASFCSKKCSASDYFLQLRLRDHHSAQPQSRVTTRVARARTGDIHYFSNLFDVGSPCDATIQRRRELVI
jgi:hypothetical protein